MTDDTLLKLLPTREERERARRIKRQKYTTFNVDKIDLGHLLTQRDAVWKLMDLNLGELPTSNLTAEEIESLEGLENLLCCLIDKCEGFPT